MNSNLKALTEWIDCSDHLPDMHGDTDVIVRLRDGTYLDKPTKAHWYRWAKKDARDDVVAYRIVANKTQEDFPNNWVECKDGSPKLPRDTEILIKRKSGFISNVLKMEQVDWSNTDLNKIEYYKVTKV